MADTIYLKKYSEKETYIAPSGAVMDSAKVKQDFPAVSKVSFIVQTDSSGEMMYGMYTLSSMRTRYGVDASLNEDAAIQAIEDAMNAQNAQMEAAASQPTAEERIAAAMEYQNIMSTL